MAQQTLNRGSRLGPTRKGSTGPFLENSSPLVLIRNRIHLHSLRFAMVSRILEAERIPIGNQFMI